MKKNVYLFLLVLFTLGLIGCAGQKAAAPGPGAEGAAAGAETAGVGRPTGLAPDELGGPDSMEDLLSRKRVYFAFDSSAIDEETRAILKAHAAYLADNPQIKVTLEGHCDERGTREYNLALGERRAQAVERMLRVLGVPADNITSTSYGEEKPVALGHNESAWRLNRRVEIIY